LNTNSGTHIESTPQARLTPAAWQVLKRLSHPCAALVFCNEGGRFHFWLHGEKFEMVRTSTIDALRRAVVMQRSRAVEPMYVISERGSALLRKRRGDADIEEWSETIAQVRGFRA
jgi:hypothetical protein